MKELSDEESSRYARHIVMKEVGREGQLKLKNSVVTVVGAGGLGSPILLYLAAAGVGTIRIVDADVVDESNLQRQVIHSTDNLNNAKVESAKKRMLSLNPWIEVISFQERLTEDNADRILMNSKIIVDAVDNIETRYIINKVALRNNIPMVHGAVGRVEGEISVFNYKSGPCYRCFLPEPPQPGVLKTGAEDGILGVLPGVIGSLQANEVIKILLGIDSICSGMILIFDSMSLQMNKFEIQRRGDCIDCGGIH